MCFSAAASLTAGTILVTTGIFSLGQVRSRASIPFASIPLLFGIQQGIEGIVWLSFDAGVLHSIAVYLFVFIAYVFWPIFVPISIRLIEKDGLRKKLLTIVSILGALIGSYLGIRIFLGPVSSNILGESICYEVPIPFPFLSFSLYFLSVCGASMLSSSPKIHIFGTTMLLGFFVAHYFYSETFFSVWCFFAAVLSMVIYIHMRDLKRLIPGIEL